MKPLVVKLGGSLAETGRLRAWLSITARARRPVVIVPGGGPFADAVRDSQECLRFSDRAAHEMALLAMHQMGLAMIALEPRLAAAETLIAIRRAAARRRIPVWLPAKLALVDRRIPSDWSITSDGLAARLAERLGSAVVLVKSASIDGGAGADALARDGVVDGTFAAIVARARLAWRVIGAGGEEEFARLVDATGEGGAVKRARDSRRLLSTRPGPHGTGRS